MNTNFTRQPPQRTASTDSHLDWLLDDVVKRVAHVQKAAVLSRDGFVLASSAALSREDAEHLSAARCRAGQPG